jgi:hypothetical protein
MSDSSRDLTDHLSKLDSDTLATLFVLMAAEAGLLELDEGHEAELKEVLIAHVASGSVEMFIADALGGTQSEENGEDR